MADYIWKCDSCDFSAEGTSSAYGSAMSHMKEVKEQGEKHSVYLADTEGNPIEDDNGKSIRDVRKAQRLGYVAPKDKRGSGASKVTESKGQRGQVKPEQVDLDPKLMFLYQWDQIITDYEGSFSQWLLDTVMGFHIQNKERLRFDVLMPELSDNQKQGGKA